MPDSNNEIFLYIKNICNKNNVVVNQILKLSQMREDSRRSNVDILLDIIPLLFGKCTYESRYYYGTQMSDLASEYLMHHFILINGLCRK